MLPSSQLDRADRAGTDTRVLLEVLAEQFPNLKASKRKMCETQSNDADVNAALVTVRHAVEKGLPPPPESIAILSRHSSFSGDGLGSVVAQRAQAEVMGICGGCKRNAAADGGWSGDQGIWYCPTCWRQWHSQHNIRY